MISNEMVTISTVACVGCGETGEMSVLRSEAETYLKGATVQSAFRSLNADEREQILTGIHGPCFDELFPRDEDW